MYQTFDAFEYLEFLRRRWRVILAACGVAVLAAASVSLLLPKHYTATARIVIEPPGGNDARLSTAVSPMYLESLKTYESFAGSDSLFAHAASQFRLAQSEGSKSIDSLKRDVLRVTKLRDTKILEIRVTLRDPKAAQSLAQYIAQETVNMSRGESAASDRDFAEQIEKQVSEAQRHLEQVEQAWSKLAVSHPVESLQTEIDAAVDLRGVVQQQLINAQTEIADNEQQALLGGQFAREQAQGARARAAVLELRSKELDRTIQATTRTLASRAAQRATVQRELKVAQSSYESASARLRDYRGAAGTRAEQLRIIDPGIVPQRPSSPNVVLNVCIALLLAMLVSIVYLSSAFMYRRRVGFEPPLARGMRA